MTALATRLAKLETARGADDLERYVNSLSDDELEARIAELTASIRADLEARGIDCTGLTSKQVVAAAEQAAAAEEQAESGK